MPIVGYLNPEVITRQMVEHAEGWVVQELDERRTVLFESKPDTYSNTLNLFESRSGNKVKFNKRKK